MGKKRVTYTIAAFMEGDCRSILLEKCDTMVKCNALVEYAYLILKAEFVLIRREVIDG